MREPRHLHPELKLIALVVAASSWSAFARADGELAWKFKEGQTLNYVMDRANEMKMDLGGQALDINTKMVFDLTWKVKSVGADGVANLEQTVDRIQVKMDSPFAQLDYDSKKPGSGEGPIWQQMGPMMEAMLGQTFTMKVTPQGAVTDIKLPEKLAEQFAKQAQGGGGGQRRGGLGGLGGGMMNENSIKELIQRTVMPLPAKAEKDATWKQHFENSMRGAGTQKTDITYSLSGKESKDGKSLDKIVAKTELTFEPAENSQADVEIMEQEGTSTILFDADAGHTVEATGVQKFVMEISAPNRDVTQDMKETVSVKLGKSPEPAADSKEEKKEPAKSDAK